MLSKEMACLSLFSLYMRYEKTNILEEITGTFKFNSLTAIVGPNGAGKSTLLKVIMGFLPFFKGNIQNTFSQTAYLPQRSEIDTSFPISVLEFVSFGMWKEIGIFRALKGSSCQKIQDTIERVGLKDHKNALLSSLSGGQFQRALFARLWLQNADLILLDEPFTGIDVRTTHDLLKIILQWHKQGKTIVAVLHDLDLVQKYFPETLLLNKTIQAWGKTKNVLEDKKALAVHVCNHPTLLETERS